LYRYVVWIENTPLIHSIYGGELNMVEKIIEEVKSEIIDILDNLGAPHKWHIITKTPPTHIYISHTTEILSYLKYKHTQAHLLSFLLNHTTTTYSNNNKTTITTTTTTHTSIIPNQPPK
jgi:hypothetical protein